MKNIIIPALIIVLIVVGIIYFGTKNRNSAPLSTPSTTNTNNSSTVSYFDENAKVMYFYSDSCSWCIKEKAVLEELAKEGYRVKPMNVGKNQGYWAQYDIQGTPTFVAPDGQKMVGYKEKDELKVFLDKYR